MIGYLLTAAVLGVAGLVGWEKMKPTAKKVRDGDSAYVNVDALRVVSSKAEDHAVFKQFLHGFMSVNAKVTAVDVQGDQGLGIIIGFPMNVAFPLSAVASIERNGMRIV